MEIRTYLTSAINSPMSGNMIDICPVGALNAAPSHMKGRTWELEEVKHISPHDCVGSNVEVNYDLDKERVVYQPVTIKPRVLIPKVIREVADKEDKNA